VERTIEKVVPATGGEKTITKETTTVVVKEEDLIIDAINKSSQSIVRITAGAANTFYGLGLVVTKEGMLVADRRAFDRNISYSVTLPDGKKYSLSPEIPKQSSSVVFFKIVKSKTDTSEFTPAIFGNSDTLQLGQSVIAIAGVASNSIATGRVSALKKTEDKPNNPGYISLIETDVVIKDIAMGGPLLNLSGQVVGLNTANITGIQSGNFIPINLIKTELAGIVL
jgi:serine protease Do